MTEAILNQQVIVLQNQTTDSIKLSEFLEGFTKSHAINDETHADLRLVAEEAFINIVDYAFDDNKSHDVRIELNYSADTISITFTDSGKAFNPLIFN